MNLALLSLELRALLCFEVTGLVLAFSVWIASRR